MSTTSSAHSGHSLLRTALFDFHVAHGARMVPFAGYEMPIQYAPGILKEHLHTRAAAGLFDVSHMGQIVVRARTGRIADAALAIERLVPVDVLALAEGRQRYALFTIDAGGVLDDLMIANRGDHLLLIVNAARKAADKIHLASALSETCHVEVLDRALLALQGPQSEIVLSRLAPNCVGMQFMDVRALEIAGAGCIVSRSGYTGEDGFEISIPVDQAESVAATLIADGRVLPIGLGARDSLRLEAGLCLYGADLDTETTPVEAGLAWAIQATRRLGGTRPGGFPGANIILKQLAGGVERGRVGLLAEGRAPVRAGAAIFAAEDDGAPIGTVTSGGFGPSVDRPVAMGYVASRAAQAGTIVFCEVRGKRLPATVTQLPFVAPKFKRGDRRRTQKGATQE